MRPPATRRWRLLSLAVLDAAAIALCAVTLVGATEPDLVFHAVWVVLVIEAFAFGARASLPRIALAALFVVTYSIADDLTGLRPLEGSDLLFTEWPFMFAIITMVAIMADRVTRTSRNLALLEQRTHEALLTARTDERRRLSSDVHDGIGQTLTALVLTLDAAEAALEDPDGDRRAGSSGADGSPGSGGPSGVQHSLEAVRRAQEIAAIALEETRDVARRLRPARTRELGLTNAVRELAANAGRPVEVRFDPRLSAPDLLPVEEQMEAYRIVQEALANAVRHASARTIQVDMQVVRGNRLQIDVTDDGDGFDVRTAGRGLGLTGMRERAAAIHATLRVQSRAGVGTQVRLLLPGVPVETG
jgi:signal transduction histidine kinase